MLGGYDGSIRIKANLDHSGFDRGLSSMSGSVKRFTGTLTKLAGMVGLAFGVGALVSFGKESIRLASDIQEVQNVIDVTFGNGAAQIEEFAQSAAEAFGLSELSAKQYAGTMGAMLKSSGVAARQAQEMSIALAGLAGDVASFYNLDPDAAFEKIRSGISGETEPLKQLGINMSMANLEAYALSEGVTKSYKSMSQAEQVLLRYNYLLSVTTDAQGDFARTSGSFANQLRILQLNFDQLRIAVGNALIPIAQAVLPGINAVISALTRLARVFAKVSALLFGKPDTGSSGQVKVQEDVASSGSAAADAAGKLAESTAGAGEAAKQAGKDMKGVLAGFDELNVLADNAANSLDGAAGGLDLSGLDTGLPEAEGGELFADAEISPKLVKEIDAFRESIGKIWDVFKESWDKNGPEVLVSAKDALTSIYGLLKSIGGAFTEAFTGGAGAEWLQSIYDKLKLILGIISSVADAFRTAFDNAGTELIESVLFRSTEVRNMWNSIRDAFIEAWNSGVGVEICEHILHIITDINNSIGTLAGRFREAWEANGNGVAVWTEILNIVESVLGFVERLTSATLEWAQGLDLEPLATSFRNLLEAAGPLVDLILDGLAYAYENVLLPLAAWAAEELAPAALDLLAAAVEALTAVLEALSPLAAWLWESFLQPLAAWTGDIVIAALETVTDALGGLAAWISEHQNDVQAFFEPAGEVIEGVGKRIRTAAEAIASLYESHIAPFIASVVEAFQTWFDAMQEGWETYIKPVLQSVTDKLNEVVQKHIGPLVEQILIFIGNIADVLKHFWDTILSPLLTFIVSGFCPKISVAIGTIGTVFNATIDAIAGLIESFLQILNGVLEFLNGVFTLDFKKIFNGIKDIVEGAINSVSSVVDGFITLITGAIDAIKSFLGFSGKAAKAEVPSQKTTKRTSVSGREAAIASASSYTASNLPRLANGAVIPPNQQFAAILGDQRSGYNVEAPLKTIEQALENVLSRSGTGGDIHITVESVLDGRVVARNTVKHINAMTRSSGRPVLLT